MSKEKIFNVFLRLTYDMGAGSAPYIAERIVGQDLGRDEVNALVSELKADAECRRYEIVVSEERDS